MIKKILKFLLPILALVSGLAAGTFFKPSPDYDEMTGPEHPGTDDAQNEKETKDRSESHATNGTIQGSSGGHGQNTDKEIAWFAFSRQFFVPLLRNGDKSGVIIITMALETDSGNLQDLSGQELRIRDIILRQLFIAANAGRFDGNFTAEGRMRGLRKQILATLQDAYGDKISAVLISDIVRHEE